MDLPLRPSSSTDRKSKYRKDKDHRSKDRKSKGFNFRDSTAKESRSESYESESVGEKEDKAVHTEPNACRPWTYRVSSIPLDWDKERLEEFLAKQLNGLKPKVASLAAEYHGQSQTATVDLLDGARLPYHLEDHNTRDTTLQADADFLGITTLFNPDPAHHRIDMSMQSIPDLATSFRESLGLVDSNKPVIVMGHSLGGLIIKETIIALHRSQNAKHKKILQSIFGIVFFAVPQLGMEMKALIAMAESGPNLGLLTSLSNTSSPLLDAQKRDFPTALGEKGEKEVFSFYETAASPTARKSGDSWVIDGPYEILVSKLSATHSREWERTDEHLCAIDATHSDIVKFGRNQIQKRIVLNILRDLGGRALNLKDHLRDPTVKFPYYPNPGFVGREDLLEKVKATLALHKSPSERDRRRLALSGLGGIGKTQIVIYLAYWIRTCFRDVSVYWVHCSNADRFRKSFDRIADEYNIPGREEPSSDVPALVRDFLQNTKHRWIMILDNADDRNLFFPPDNHGNDSTISPALKQYIPECIHGSILLTTRDENLGIDFLFGKIPVNVEKFSDRETCMMVRRLYRYEATDRDISELSERLEYVPLALAQDLAYMNKCRKSISSYIQILDQNDETLVKELSRDFETIGRDRKASNAVAETWCVSFDHIKDIDPLAGELMSLMCLFDRQAILEEFIIIYQQAQRRPELRDCANAKPQEHRAQILDDDDATISRIDSLGTLMAYSFITQTGEGMYDMHRLVQLVTRNWLRRNQNMKAFGSEAVWSVYRASPEGLTWEGINDFSRIVPHARAVLSHKIEEIEPKHHFGFERAHVMLLMGNYYLRKSQLPDAERYVGGARQLFEAGPAANSLGFFDASDRLLDVYNRQGRWSKAIDLGSIDLQRCIEMLGREREQTFNMMVSVASAYCGTKDLRKAEQLLLEASEVRRILWANEHTLESLAQTYELAIVYRELNELDKSRELLLEHLHNLEKLCGRRHPDTLASLNSLALLYEKQGDLDEAAKLLTHVHQTSEEIQGTKHRDTLVYLLNIARIHGKKGDLERATEAGGRAWKLLKETLGENHHDSIISLSQYAQYCFDYGNAEQAVGLVQNCLSQSIPVLGNRHPDIQWMRKVLTQWEEALGSGD